MIYSIRTPIISKIIILILLTQFITTPAQITVIYSEKTHENHNLPKRLIRENLTQQNKPTSLKNPFQVEKQTGHEFINESIINTWSIPQKSGFIDPLNLTDNTVRNHLIITDNANFTNTAIAEGWKGDGSETKPIIIANYNFTSSTTESYRISIENVSLFFIIRNCILNGTGNSGSIIHFENVTNGLILGNIIQEADPLHFGLFISNNSYNNTVKYNIFNNSAVGENANVFCDNASNIFVYNHWDNYDNTSDINNDGVFDGWYSHFNGSAGSIDKAPRVYKRSWNHKTISITSNAALDTLAKDEGWLGNGTDIFPYKITNINITTPNATGPSIDVGFTDRYLRFENCYIQNNQTFRGIHIDSASNIIVNQSTIRNCSEGLTIEGSSTFNKFTYMTINNCINQSILLIEGNYTFFGYNYLFNNSVGIEIDIVTYETEIRNNSIADCEYGTHVDTIGNCSIYGNRVQNNSHSGIFLNSGYIDIINNISYNNTVNGIYCSTYYSNITGNYVYNNSLIGLNLDSDNFNVSNNYVYFNVDGIWGGGENTTIEKNTIFGNRDYGIFLSPAIGAWVTRNRVYSNGDGIAIWNINCYNNKIFLNDIFNNTNHQVWDQNSNSDLNQFSHQMLGNYYGSDYTGVDLNDDKVGEDIYSFVGNNDSYPLTTSIDYFANVTFFETNWPTIVGSEIRSNEYITVNGSLSIPNTADLKFYNVILRFSGVSNGSINFQVSAGNFSSYNSLITSANLTNRFYLRVLTGSIFNLENTTINYAGYSVINPGVSIETDDCTIINCTFSDNYSGTVLENSNNITIIESTFQDSIEHGLYLISANNTWCDNCTMIGNNKHGFNAWDSKNITINNSVMRNNLWEGIRIQQGSHSIIDSTNVSYNRYGVFYNDGGNCTITRSKIWNITYDGISMWATGTPSAYNSITKVDISNCSKGIYFHDVNLSEIIDCNIFDNNLYGIHLHGSVGIYCKNNEISQNNISSNLGTGIYVNVAIDNRLFSNRFSNNNFQVSHIGVDISDTSNNNTFQGNYFLSGDTAYDLGVNTHWDNGTHGNYWSGYLGYDSDGDGIGEYPYLISGDVFDNFPLGFFVSFKPIILQPMNITYLTVAVPVVINASNYAVNCWYQIYHSGSWSNNVTLTFNITSWVGVANLIPGESYGLRAFINDSFGFENTSDIIYFSITQDFTPPTITLQSPFNGSIVQSRFPIVLDILESNGSLIYNWDMENNVTDMVDDPVLIFLPSTDGLHSLEIFVTDEIGNWQYVYYEFTVDDTDPLIEPFDVTDDTEVGTETWIPFTVNDTHYEMFWYYWVDAEDQSSELLYTTTPGTLAPSTPGDWELHVFANDSAGNEASLTIDLKVLTALELTLIYPNGGETVGGLCEVTWSNGEDLNYSLYYSPDDGLTWFTLATNVNTSVWVWDTTTVDDGTDYLVRVVCTTPGQPGEAHSESVFTIKNQIGELLPPGTYTYTLPDVTFEITVSEATNITLQRMTNVPSSIQPNSTIFDVTGLYLEVLLDNPDAFESMSVTFSYEKIEEDLIAQGVNISSLSVYFYNETSEQWELADIYEIDLEEKTVTGYFEHTTVIGVLGRSKGSDRGENPFLLIFITLITLTIAIGGGLLVYDHRRKRAKGELSFLEKLKNLYRKDSRE